MYRAETVLKVNNLIGASARRGASRCGARPFYGPTPTAFGGCESNLGFDVLARLSDRVPDAVPSKSEEVLGLQFRWVSN